MSLDGEKMEDLKIICVSTGTKCVNGEHMSVNGNSLNGENVNEVLKLGLLILFQITNKELFASIFIFYFRLSRRNCFKKMSS